MFEGENEYSKYGHTRLAEVVKEIVGSSCNKANTPNVEMQVISA